MPTDNMRILANKPNVLHCSENQEPMGGVPGGLRGSTGSSLGTPSLQDSLQDAWGAQVYFNNKLIDVIENHLGVEIDLNNVPDMNKDTGGQWAYTLGDIPARKGELLGNGIVVLSNGLLVEINRNGEAVVAYNGSDQVIAAQKVVYVVQRQTGEWDIIMESCG